MKIKFEKKLHKFLKHKRKYKEVIAEIKRIGEFTNETVKFNTITECFIFSETRKGISYWGYIHKRYIDHLAKEENMKKDIA